PTPDQDNQRLTPLHVACASALGTVEVRRSTAQLEVVRLLNAHGADLAAVARYRGLDCVTPLICACWSSGNISLVRWLLDHGAAPDARALLAALGHFQRHKRGSYDIAELLLAYGINVDGAPRERTPLRHLAHEGDGAAVGCLLSHGANTKVWGPGGRTAAPFAAERNPGHAT